MVGIDFSSDNVKKLDNLQKSIISILSALGEKTSEDTVMVKWETETYVYSIMFIHLEDYVYHFFVGVLSK